MDGTYRSYVVRAWSRGQARMPVTRIAIEEVQSGRQVALMGAAAADFGAQIAAVFAPPATAGRPREEQSVILVVGATGELGGQITRRLVERGERVRILVRPGSAFEPLVELGCEPALGDLKEARSLEAACGGIATIVASAASIGRQPPDTVETVELGGYERLIAAARTTGVRQLVFVSARAASADSPAPFMAAKAATEERLKASGLAWTILAPEAFMDSWLAMVVAGPALEGREVVYVGDGRRLHSFVHSRDVAALAAACAGNPAAENRYLPIGGPTAISFRGAVAAFERAVGRPIPQRGVDPGEPVPGLPPLVAGMLAMLESADSALDSSAIAAEFDLHLTSVEDWAFSLAAVPVG